MNSPTGGPELAQIVTVRDIGKEAQIAHLELIGQARAIVGHELAFTAIPLRRSEHPHLHAMRAQRRRQREPELEVLCAAHGPSARLLAGTESAFGVNFRRGDPRPGSLYVMAAATSPGARTGRQGTDIWPDLPSPRFLHPNSKSRRREVPTMTVIAGRNRQELTEDFMTELTLHPADAATASATRSQWSTTLPASTGSPQARPNSAPAYYLGRPASWWITTHHRRPQPPA